MVFDYFSFARAKKNQEELEKTNPQNPVLNEEDEHFLEKVTSSDIQDAPLPPSSMTGEGSNVAESSQAAQSTKLPEQTAAESSQLKMEHRQERTWASYIPTAASLPTVPNMPAMPNMPSMPTWRSKAAAKGSSDPTASEGYPAGVRVTENVKLDDARREEDEKEVTVLLDRLNLSSINNRVFSFSAQSQKLYSDFTIVLKDLINGVPTAYQDLEKLLKENDAQLRTMFKTMPPFIKTFVMSLLSKFGTSSGPEILAAASNKPGLNTKFDTEDSKDEKKKKQKRTFPSIKRLATERGAVAAALRSIVSFLQTRFPAFVTGTNVIMSLAVFVLLFAFWYCHKRGRETRLQKEAGLEEASEDELLDDDEEEQDETEKGLTDAEIKAILERGPKTADTAATSSK